MTGAQRGDSERPASSTAGPWWHAFGRVRNLAPEGAEPAEVWQLTVVSPSTVDPDRAAALGADAWGDYLTSWDHEPTDDEKNAVTPPDYRDEEPTPDA